MFQHWRNGAKKVSNVSTFFDVKFNIKFYYDKPRVNPKPCFICVVEEGVGFFNHRSFSEDDAGLLLLAIFVRRRFNGLIDQFF